MKEFSRNIGNILAVVADILQPRDFDEFEKYGFDAPATGNAEPTGAGRGRQ